MKNGSILPWELPRMPCHIYLDRAHYDFGLYRTYGVLLEYPTGLVELTVVYRLREYIKCVKGDMGNALTLFWYFTLLIDIIMYGVFYYVVDSLTYP